MTGFSSDWLRLREAADHRSRNTHLAETLAARFALRDAITVTDIGCGTGSNLRGTYSLLPHTQTWTLVDYDTNLLAAARAELSSWADTAGSEGENTLRLTKGRFDLIVQFRQADLAADLDKALGDKADLITAAAFFDLTSEDFIKKFAKAVRARKAAFYTVLTYNGVTRWSPHHPVDNQIAAEFHRHQRTDKGFGPSAGPTAPLHLADQFQLAEYSVQEGDSPWELDVADQALIDELQEGHAKAVSETKAIGEKQLAAWSALKRTGVLIGHTDTLAFPT
ncbi:MAG: class I SAM-dependent methyltransferase [Filomicrobium sp.]